MTDGGLVLRALAPLLWLAVGYLIGRRLGRVGHALLWAALWGPIGIAGLLYGARFQSKIEPEPRTSSTPDALDLGSMVNVWVGGEFRLGTIQSWREADGVVETLVRHTDERGVVTTSWIRPEYIRLP